MNSPEIEIINATPDEKGRVVLDLYGKKFEIGKNEFDEYGIATLKQFGKIYEIHKPSKKKKANKKKKEEPLTMGDVLPQEKESVSV